MSLLVCFINILGRKCAPKSSTSKPYQAVTNSNNNDKRKTGIVITKGQSTNDNISKALSKR